MQDLLSLLGLIVAFGGLSIIGLVILLGGLVAAERTSAVIWCAVVAGLLFAIQLGWIAFWHSFGVGFGGEDIKGRTILQWGSVISVVLVSGFLAWKLPAALGKVVEKAQWWRDGARVSALIIVVYVLYHVGGVLLRGGLSGQRRGPAAAGCLDHCAGGRGAGVGAVVPPQMGVVRGADLRGLRHCPHRLVCLAQVVGGRGVCIHDDARRRAAAAAGVAARGTAPFQRPQALCGAEGLKISSYW